MCRAPPSCCQSCNDQTCAVMKVMFSNVPDNTPAVVFLNEDSGEVADFEQKAADTFNHSPEEVFPAKAS